MTKEEIILLLKQNGYAQHPVFKFFHIPKNNLSRYFLFNDDNTLTAGKLKWGQLDLKEYKTLKFREFNPSSYSLKTELDRKREVLMMQRIAQQKAKTKKFLEPKVDYSNQDEEGVNN